MESKRKRDNDFEKKCFQKKLDTIEGHHNKHTIEDQGCLWTTPLKNCLDVFLGVSSDIKYFVKLNSLKIPKEWS